MILTRKEKKLESLMRNLSNRDFSSKKKERLFSNLEPKAPDQLMEIKMKISLKKYQKLLRVRLQERLRERITRDGEIKFWMKLKSLRKLLMRK